MTYYVVETDATTGKGLWVSEPIFTRQEAELLTNMLSRTPENVSYHVAESWGEVH